MIRIVADTNIVASGLLWNGAPRRLLDHAHAGHVRLCASAPLLGELAEVLERRQFANRLALARMSAADAVVQYVGLVTFVTEVPIRRTAPDPNDDIVLAAAIAAKADIIVTGDKALRSLGNFSGIPLLNVNDALDRIHRDIASA